MIRFWLIALFLILTSPATARIGNDHSVGFDFAVGLPTVSIESDNSDEAIYGGIAFQGKGFLPIGKLGLVKSDFVLGIKYNNLTNTANSGSGEEHSTQLGGSLGLNFSIFKFFVGVDYSLMKNTHYWIGTDSQKLDYSTSLFGYHAGIRIPFSKVITIKFSYEAASGVVPKEKLVQTKDAPYKESIIWIRATFATGKKSKDFMPNLID